MRNGFATWLEGQESDDAIKAAVIDAIPEDIKDTIHDEDEMLELNTDSLQLHPEELLSRGEIKRVMNPSLEKQVRQAFGKGATIQELINILQGGKSAPTASPEHSIPPPSQPVNTGI